MMMTKHMKREKRKEQEMAEEGSGSMEQLLRAHMVEELRNDGDDEYE